MPESRCWDSFTELGQLAHRPILPKRAQFQAFRNPQTHGTLPSTESRGERRQAGPVTSEDFIVT